MLTNGRITCFNSVSRPTRSRRLFSLRGSFVSYVGRNMLFYPIPQSLGCAPYVARITLARKFINDGTFLFGRDAILLNGWKGSPSAVNNPRIDSKETIGYGLPNVVKCLLFSKPFSNSVPQKNCSHFSSRGTLNRRLRISTDW